MRCVASVDRAVGSVLDYLEENGLSENTIVVYTSDQGFYLGEHGWFDKRWMYEESFKMPFLIKNPRTIEAGTTSDAMIMNVDFAPTLLDMAGLQIPSEIQGKSFKEALNGNDKNERKSVYYHYYEYPIWHKVQPHYGVKTDRYKLMHFYYSMDEWELYDLKTDPNEMHNIYSEAPKELIESLKKELEVLRKEYKDDGSLEEMRKMTDTVIQRVYNEPDKLMEIILLLLKTKYPIMNKILMSLTILTVSCFNMFAQTSSFVSDCDNFIDGPNENWPYVLVATTVADTSESQESQTFSMNISSLPDDGANFRVYKTTANGNDYFGNPVSLTLGLNSFTVSAVTFDRAVKFQFSSGDIEFIALSLNEVDSDCVDPLPTPSSALIRECSDFVSGA